MSINNNIWELAEGYAAGTLSQTALNDLNGRLAADSDFANEFNECVNLLRSMNDSGKQRRFKTMLREIHAELGDAASQKTARKIHLPAHFWRTAAVAAGIALLTTTITYSILNPTIKKSDSQYNAMSREVEHLKKVQAQQQAQQNQLIQNINKNTKPAPPPSDVKYTGTGFALTNDGYLVTAYHVLNDGKGDFDSVYIQTHDGQYYKAFLVNFNSEADLAILKVEKKGFHFGKGEVPFAFASNKVGIGTRIFTLGYTTDDIQYSEGYISSKNGFEGDAEQYTLELPIGHGQSGSPVVDEKGNILGVLTAKGSQSEANTYAVTSKALADMVHNLTDNTVIRLSKKSRLGSIGRPQQIEKMEDYTVSVKVYKK